MGTAVVICTCDRPSSLSSALESCLSQTVSAVEVIVIDDGELSDEFVEHWSHRLSSGGIKLVYRRKHPERRGVTISRNMAWRLSSAEVVLYLDDDARLDRRCVGLVDEVFSADVGGELAGMDFPIEEKTRVHRGRRVIERLYDLAGLWSVLRRYYRRRSVGAGLGRFRWLVQVPYLRGGAMAVRREMLERLGGFDESLGGHAMGEDKEISIRLSREGLLMRVLSVPVEHYSEPSGRESPEALGYETIYNYLYINSKVYRLGVGEVILLGYTVVMLCGIELAFACMGDRKSHVRQFTGMVTGLVDFVTRSRRRR